MTDTYMMIKKAIQEKRSMYCSYNGYDRKVSPHVLGKTNGKEQALFYQFDGESERGLRGDGTDWKCFHVDKIEDARIIEDEFQTGTTKTDRRSSCVKDIDIEVIL